MNDQSHKLITAEYITEVNYAVPRDWEVKDIDIKYGELYYKGEHQVVPMREDEDDMKYPNIIEDNDDDEVSQFFDCVEEEEPEVIVLTVKRKKKN